MSKQLLAHILLNSPCLEQLYWFQVDLFFFSCNVVNRQGMGDQDPLEALYRLDSDTTRFTDATKARADAFLRLPHSSNSLSRTCYFGYDFVLPW